MEKKKKNWRGCFAERHEARVLGLRLSDEALFPPFAVPGSYASLMTLVYSEPRLKCDEEGRPIDPRRR